MFQAVPAPLANPRSRPWSQPGTISKGFTTRAPSGAKWRTLRVRIVRSRLAAVAAMARSAKPGEPPVPRTRSMIIPARRASRRPNGRIRSPYRWTTASSQSARRPGPGGSAPVRFSFGDPLAHFGHGNCRKEQLIGVCIHPPLPSHGPLPGSGCAGRKDVRIDQIHRLQNDRSRWPRVPGRQVAICQAGRDQQTAEGGDAPEPFPLCNSEEDGARLPAAGDDRALSVRRSFNESGQRGLGFAQLNRSHVISQRNQCSHLSSLRTPASVARQRCAGPAAHLARQEKAGRPSPCFPTLHPRPTREQGWAPASARGGLRAPRQRPRPPGDAARDPLPR